MKPESNIPKESREYENYYILGVGEGGGYTGWKDKSIALRYPKIQEKVRKGAKYISIEKSQIPDFVLGELRRDPERNTEVRSRYQRFISDWEKRYKDDPQMLNRVMTSGDVRDLPFPDASIDEVVVENVFGDGNARVAESAIQELERVLAGDGVVKIFESITPETAIDFINQIQTVWWFDVKILTGQDLVQYLVKEEGLSLEAAQHRAGNKNKTGRYANFMAVLKKKKPVLYPN
jgi:SAM-dependent methyltransferase